MVGQGVLRECLLDPGVDCILSVGRSSSEVDHPKFREIVHRDLKHQIGAEEKILNEAVRLDRTRKVGAQHAPRLRAFAPCFGLLDSISASFNDVFASSDRRRPVGNEERHQLCDFLGPVWASERNSAQ